MWQLAIEATKASSGSTWAGFEKGTGTTGGAGDAGTVTPPSKVHVCSRENRRLRKASPSTGRTQRTVALWSAMGLRLQSRDLAVVVSAQQRQGRDRSHEGREHVPLSVPLIALRAEEGVRALPADEGRPPLDELVGRADGQAHADDQEREPLAGPERRPADQDLADDDRGHEALGEVPEAIVGVAGEPQRVGRPVPERH